RLSVVRQLLGDEAVYLGPFASTRAAEQAAAAFHDALPLRQCTAKLSPRIASPACALAELGRCPAPCELRISVDDYARQATERVLAWLERDGTRLVHTSDGWGLPADGASRFRTLLTKCEQAASQPYVHQ